MLVDKSNGLLKILPKATQPFLYLLAEVEKVIVLAELEQDIKNAIDDNGEVLDSASDTVTFTKEPTAYKGSSSKRTA